jgi:hypothetical protein
LTPAEEGTKKGALGKGLGLFAAGQQRGGVGRTVHGYDPGTHSILMGLLYELIVDTEDGTTTLQLEANSKEEALESAQELYPGCRLALISPEPGEQKG